MVNGTLNPLQHDQLLVHIGASRSPRAPYKHINAEHSTSSSVILLGSKSCQIVLEGHCPPHPLQLRAYLSHVDRPIAKRTWSYPTKPSCIDGFKGCMGCDTPNAFASFGKSSIFSYHSVNSAIISCHSVNYAAVLNQVTAFSA